MTTTVPAEVRRFDRVREIFIIGFTATMAAVFAFLAAALGIKGLVAGIGGLGLVTLLVVVRKNRSLVLMFGVVMGFRRAPAQDDRAQVFNVESGALGLSISSVDVVIVLLYMFWALDGTIAA